MEIEEKIEEEIELKKERRLPNKYFLIEEIFKKILP